MDKKGIAAVALAIITLVAWQYYYARLTPPPRPVTTPAATASASPAAVAQASASPSVRATTTPAEKSSAPTEPAVAAKVLDVPTGSVDYTFTNLGGGIESAKLKKHLAEDGTNVVINTKDSAPIGALSDTPGEVDRSPYNLSLTETKDAVVAERTGANQVQIVKKFTLPQGAKGKDEYLIDLDVAFTNHSDKPFDAPGYYLCTGGAQPIHRNDLPTYTGFDWFRNGSDTTIDVMWFSPSSIPLVGIQTRPARSLYDPGDQGSGILWTGVTNQYFTSLITISGTTGNRVWATRSEVPNTDDPSHPRYRIEGAVGVASFRLEPGKTVHHQFSLYVGPKEYRLLKTLGDSQSDIMHFGWPKPVSLLLLAAMNALKGLLGNYVAAIVALTLCIKTLLWFPQNRATQSMKRMQALQPKMTELREKYKDDPTRMNTELMKLYKDYGVNPFGGCWPMLIQIPIFFGFFRMLGQTVELRGAGFLWVHDLSQPDTVAHLMGIPINVLPLCMAGTMLWQMSLTPKGGDPMQQRISMFIPLIFVYFCYNFASALALYYTVQNLFSIVQLYVTRNQPVPALRKLTPPKGGKKR